MGAGVRSLAVAAAVALAANSWFGWFPGPLIAMAVAFMLAYDGAPLGVIAYVDPSGAPVALCIIANDAPDAPMRSERRGDLSLAWWSRGGRSRLVIARIPEERAVALAQTLEKRI